MRTDLRLWPVALAAVFALTLLPPSAGHGSPDAGDTTVQSMTEGITLSGPEGWETATHDTADGLWAAWWDPVAQGGDPTRVHLGEGAKIELQVFRSVAPVDSVEALATLARPDQAMVDSGESTVGGQAAVYAESLVDEEDLRTRTITWSFASRTYFLSLYIAGQSSISVSISDQYATAFDATTQSVALSDPASDSSAELLSETFLVVPASIDLNVQQGWWYHPDVGRTLHEAIDYIDTAINTPATAFTVRAAADGVATYRPASTGGLGNYVSVSHTLTSGTLYTLYAHLDSSPLPAFTPTTVSRGEGIGIAGATGAVSCCPPYRHLHFELADDSYGQQPIDPYDIYDDRDAYPDPCGPNYYWTVCPPEWCPAPVAPYADGSLFSEENSAGIYVIYGQARFAIPDPQTLIDLGLAGEPVICVPDGFMGSVSATPEDGTMLQQLGSATQYIVNCSAKFGIPDPATVILMVTNGYGNSYPNLVPSGALGILTSVPYEGCHFGEHESLAQWVTCQDQKWLIPDTNAVVFLGLSGATQRTMWPGALNSFFATFSILNGVPCGDSDGDGHTNLAETFMGTDPDERCGEGPEAVSDKWPSDLDGSTPIPDSIDRISVNDLTRFLVPPRLGTSPGDTNYDRRLDLVPGPTFPDPSWIALTDLTALIAGDTGFPPMFGGAKAFGGPKCTDP